MVKALLSPEREERFREMLARIFPHDAVTLQHPSSLSSEQSTYFMVESALWMPTEDVEITRRVNARLSILLTALEREGYSLIGSATMPDGTEITALLRNGERLSVRVTASCRTFIYFSPGIFDAVITRMTEQTP